MLKEEEERMRERKKQGLEQVFSRGCVSGLRVDEMAMGNSPGIIHSPRTRCMHALKGSKGGGSVSGARRNDEGGLARILGRAGRQ